MFVYLDYFWNSDAENLYARDYFDDTFILTICSSKLKIFSFSILDVLWSTLSLERYFVCIHRQVLHIGKCT